jgi:hypothetical protein
MHGADDINTFLTTEDLAVRYDLKPDTIKRWRVCGRGPTFYKAGQLAIDLRTPRIRYKLADVLAWEQSNNITPIN